MGTRQANLTPKDIYLILYNTLCGGLWARVLVTVLATPVPEAYTELEYWTRWTQSIAILEVLHAAIGKSINSVISLLGY